MLQSFHNPCALFAKGEERARVGCSERSRKAPRRRAVGGARPVSSRAEVSPERHDELTLDQAHLETREALFPRNFMEGTRRTAIQAIALDQNRTEHGRRNAGEGSGRLDPRNRLATTGGRPASFLP